MASKKRRGESGSSSQSLAQYVPPPREPVEPPQVVGEITPRSFGFRLNNLEHREKFDHLKNRHWTSTRFLDFEFIGAMGIQDDLEWMAEKVGWMDFLRLREPTYRGLTLEFLSTLEADILQGQYIFEGRCTFRLGNQDRELTLNEVNEIFGFPMVDSVGIARSESRAY